MKSWKHTNWNPWARSRLNGEGGPDASHLSNSGAERKELRAQANAVPSRGTKLESTWSSSVTSVPSWPEEARPLKQYTWISYLYLIGDLILALLPVYFILLAIAAIILNGKPTKDNDFGKKVEVATDLGPTIFPIVFAAITGRSMKMIARFLAERGAKLNTLELLMASQSVWGTVESQLLMRRLTLVGVNLLFLWAMSPLGGQASLRLVGKSIKKTDQPLTLRYQSTGPAALAVATQSSLISYFDLGRVSPTYTSSILAPNEVKNSPEDAWGHIKIPRLEGLDASGTDSEGWIPVPREGVAAENYSSLIGIPIINRPVALDASFHLETSYLTMECGRFRQTNISDSDIDAIKRLVPGSDGWATFDMPDAWYTASFFIRSVLPDIPPKYEIHPRVDALFGFVNKSSTSDSIPRRVVTYASGFWKADSFALNTVNCSVGQRHVEAAVDCEEKHCGVARVRESKVDQGPVDLTALELPLVRNVVLPSFWKAFGTLGRNSSPTEQFLFNTSTFPVVGPTASSHDNPGWVDLSELAPEVFSRRLALAFNTYYQVSLAPEAYMGSMPTKNLTVYGPEAPAGRELDAYLPSNMSTKHNTMTEWQAPLMRRVYDGDIMFVGATTNATIIQKDEIYICNYAWVALLLTASSILLLTGGASLVLKHKTLGPEMFGFVASMTYENPHVSIPRGGTMLDAMERARLLKDVTVRIGDVKGDGEVGHIAFAAGVPLRKLERSRTYA